MKLLLDTNVYVAFRRGHPGVVDIVREAESLVLSAVTVGELLLGFRLGARFYENLKALEELLDSPGVTFAPVTFSTADSFGLVSAALRRKGAPIPTNDIWIAAHAFETGSQLVTFDRHFEHVDNLAKLIL
ncbi:MAG: type II toxin-antitoxin system VapC family toxin [Candidatus Riflebacteria bacterium]|nr:type II toxin-antitoxin system VapC family toxin [Candidatus Riflebacteria bacterium]